VGLFRNGVDPWSAAVLRPLVGTVLLIPLLLAHARAAHRQPARRDRSGRAVLLAALVGGAPLGLFQVAYARSTDALGVPATVALLYLSPALILALQGPLFGDRPSRSQVGMAAVSVAGVWMVVLGTGIGAVAPRGAGVLWGLLTGASFGAYVLFGRWMTPRMGAVPTLTWSTAGAGALLLATNGLLQRPLTVPASGVAWLLLVGLAVATLPAASLLFFAALSRIDPGRASVGATVEPLVGTLLAVALLGQEVGGWGWIGMTVLIAGVVGTSLLTPVGAGSPPLHPPPRGS
jgi:drug/metabolite transporter (DMT)-like permease